MVAPWNGSPSAKAAHDACTNHYDDVIEILKQQVIIAGSACKLEPACGTLVPYYVSPYLPADSRAQFPQFSIAQEYLSGAMCGLSGQPLTVRETFTRNGAGLWLMNAVSQQVGVLNWGGEDQTTNPNAPYSGNDGLVPWNSCNIHFQADDAGTTTTTTTTTTSTTTPTTKSADELEDSEDAASDDGADSDLSGHPYRPTPDHPFYVGLFSHEDGPCFVPDGPHLDDPDMKRPCQWYVNMIGKVRQAWQLPARAPQTVLEDQNPVEVDVIVEDVGGGFESVATFLATGGGSGSDPSKHLRRAGETLLDQLDQLDLIELKAQLDALDRQVQAKMALVGQQLQATRDSVDQQVKANVDLGDLQAKLDLVDQQVKSAVSLVVEKWQSLPPVDLVAIQSKLARLLEVDLQQEPATTPLAAQTPIEHVAAEVQAAKEVVESVAEAAKEMINQEEANE